MHCMMGCFLLEPSVYRLEAAASLSCEISNVIGWVMFYIACILIMIVHHKAYEHNMPVAWPTLDAWNVKKDRYGHFTHMH